MGEKEYYQVLGQAVDDGEFESQIKDANADDKARLKQIVRAKTGLELNDADLSDVKAIVDNLPKLPRIGGPSPYKWRY
jgi:hypothetical protein